MQCASGKMNSVSKRLPIVKHLERGKSSKSKPKVKVQVKCEIKEEEKDSDDTEIYELNDPEDDCCAPAKRSPSKTRRPRKKKSVETAASFEMPTSTRPVRIRKPKIIKDEMFDDDVKPKVRRTRPRVAKTEKKIRVSLSTQSSYDPCGSNSSYVSSQDSSEGEFQSVKEKELSPSENWPTKVKTFLLNEETRSPEQMQVETIVQKPPTLPKLKIQKQGENHFMCSSLDIESELRLINSSAQPNFIIVDRYESFWNEDSDHHREKMSQNHPLDSTSSARDTSYSPCKKLMNSVQDNLLSEKKLSALNNARTLDSVNNVNSVCSSNHPKCSDIVNSAQDNLLSKQKHFSSDRPITSSLVMKRSNSKKSCKTKKRSPHYSIMQKRDDAQEEVVSSSVGVTNCGHSAKLSGIPAANPNVHDTVSKLRNHLNHMEILKSSDVYYELPMFASVPSKVDSSSESKRESSFYTMLENADSPKKDSCLYGAGYVSEFNGQNELEHRRHHTKLSKFLHSYHLQETNSMDFGEIDSKPILRIRKKKSSKKNKDRHKKSKERHSNSHKKLLESSGHTPKEWADLLGDLWQYQPTNFQAEQEFNKRSSLFAPHCTVCRIFKSFKGLRKDVGLDLADFSEEVAVEEIPSHSRVLIPSPLFLSVTESEDESSLPPVEPSNNGTPLELNRLLDHDDTAALFTCQQCNVCVHSTCYGILSEDQNWLCDRCSRNQLAMDCCLCSMRGGALKPTINGLWAHVLCAIIIPEVFFTNVVTKDVVDQSRIPKCREKLLCYLCGDLEGCLRSGDTGVCIQCGFGKCPTRFHVTCAHLSGVQFSPHNGAYPVKITCRKHFKSKVMPRDLRPLQVGERVIGKQSNKRYYHCNVLAIEEIGYNSVDFCEGATCFSNDVLDDDILSPMSSLVVGEFTDVNWKGQPVKCVYKGRTKVCNVKVEFEDGSQMVAKRDELYTVDETLPKRVFSRLSFATEQKNPLFQELQEVPHEDDLSI